MTLFMSMFLILIFYFFITSSYSASDKFEIKTTADPQVVTVNSTTFLKCILKFPSPEADKGFSSMWQSPTKNDVGEKCIVYEKYQPLIEPYCNTIPVSSSNKFKTIIRGIKIKAVKWEHRGLWVCRYAQNSSQIMVNVQVPPPVENIKVDMISNSGEVSKEKLVGKGTRDDPYDMRSNQGAKLTCWTDCGYPKPEITWKFKSVNRRVGATMKGVPVPDTFKNTQAQKKKVCDLRDKTTNLLQSHFSSTMFTNCTLAGMDGLTEVTCEASGPHYHNKPSRRVVYFTCPGEAETKLTTGEIIAIGFGGGIAILLLIGAFVVIKGAMLNSSRGTQLPQEDASGPIVGV